jgi:hypothetical protein
MCRRELEGKKEGTQMNADKKGCTQMRRIDRGRS